jgi:hypothetical protein
MNDPCCSLTQNWQRFCFCLTWNRVLIWMQLINDEQRQNSTPCLIISNAMAALVEDLMHNVQSITQPFRIYACKCITKILCF